MNTLTFVLVMYVLIGIGTASFAYFNGGEHRRARMIGWPLIWPLVWFMVVQLYVSGRAPAKCIWCGKVVASGHKDDIDLWRAHYLEECKEHPLRKEIDKLEDELKPFREIKNSFVRKMEVRIDGLYKTALYGPEPYDPARRTNDQNKD